MSSSNKSLGRFDLSDIPSAARGVPQIEVTFDIDANGILNVSAKDKNTGKEQNIIIKASSGLSEDDISSMLKDAEANAESDKEFNELVGVRNSADSLLHSVNKSLNDLGEKITSEEREKVEIARSNLEQVLKDGNKNQIQSKIKDLENIFTPISQNAYKKNDTSQNDASADSTNTSHSNSTSTNNEDSEVVDAECEEIDESSKK
jgi:molecular chaperone DnaK